MKLAKTGSDETIQKSKVKIQEIKRQDPVIQKKHGKISNDTQKHSKRNIITTF